MGDVISAPPADVRVGLYPAIGVESLGGGDSPVIIVFDPDSLGPVGGAPGIGIPVVELPVVAVRGVVGVLCGRLPDWSDCH